MYFVFVATLPNHPSKSIVECTHDQDVFARPTSTWTPVAVAAFPDEMTSHACVLRDAILRPKQVESRVALLGHIAQSYGTPWQRL